MKKIVLFVSLICFLFINLKSTHLLGGELRFEQIGSNQFRVLSRIALSPSGIVTDSLEIKIFDKVTHINYSINQLYKDSTNQFTHPTNRGYSVKFAYYSDTISLPNNPNGFYVTHSGCCRGNNSNATGNLILSCEIPNPGIAGGNANPKFIQSTDSLYALCIGRVIDLNFACTDLDGDSLVYSLTPRYDSTSPGGMKPLWYNGTITGHSLIPYLGPGSVCSLSSKTGILSGRPVQLGLYSISIRCEEYRSGVKIGEVYRDIIAPGINSCLFSSITKLNNLETYIHIYPNPNTGNFSILIKETIHPFFNLELFDVSGKLVHSEDITTSLHKVDLNHLEEGIYIVKLNNDSNQVIKQIIVQ